jgi:hypothetical protein
VFYKIFNTWIAGCDSLAAQGEFEQAVKCYHQVETRLDTSIQEGHIEIAARINRVTTSQKHDSAGRLEYRDDMIKHLLDGESMIWSGQYPAASRFVDSIGEQFRTNGFANDPLVVNAILKYRNKIREQICWDSKEAYEIFTLRAQHEIEKRKFLAAGILLDSALLIASSTPLCKINASDPTDTLRKYSAAIEYQKHIMEIRDYIRVDNYDQALKQNVMADGLYRENYLNRFGIEFFSLYDVINANGDLLFTGHAVVFYSNMDSLQEAFRYVKLLRSQGYPKRSAKDFLDILGKKMAKEDFRKYPTEDPASLVDGYTRYDGWFRSFKASYLNVSRKNKLMNRRSIDKQ